ncbi:MAG: hypothetical protein OEV78_04810 [Spirochaetia bacterium]|nr:hypothetical protein [Spirochaetia bacterium]
MSKIKKVLGWGFGILISLVIITGIAIKIIVTKDFIAAKIENAINGRVEIRDISVPIWAAFSGITIDGFKISNKDAEMQKPMKDRTPVVKEVIGFEKFEFKVAVGKLIMSLGKNFEIKSMLFVKPKAEVILYEKGGNNILPLLVKNSENSKDEAKSTAEQEKNKPKSAASEKKTDESGKAFSIKSVPGIIKMGKIGMEGGEFTVYIQKIQNKLILNDVNFILKDIYIDPQNLDKPEKNQVNLASNLKMELKENKKVDSAVSSFLFAFSLNGVIQPFNAQTGYPTQFATAEAVFHKGSKMNGLVVFEKLKKGTEQLKKIGISMDFLKDNIELADDSKMKLEYNSGKITFLNALLINSADSNIVVDEKSWIDINSYEHLMTGSIKLSASHSATVENQVDNALKPAIAVVLTNVPANLRSTAAANLKVESIRNNVLKPARDEKNLITLGYKTFGKLSGPTVSIVKPDFPSTKEVVAQESKKLQGSADTIVKEQLNNVKKQATTAAEQAVKKETSNATNAATESAKTEATKKLKKLF